MSGDHEIFELGNLVLQSGATLRGAQLAYKTHGALNLARDNVIVYPTAFGGDYTEYEPRIKPGMALDPDKYFIIVPSLFGGGLSSSPSNTPEPYGGPRFPQVTIYDNVVAQHRLVEEKFGVSRVKLVTGFSMGAIQTYLSLGRALSRRGRAHRALLRRGALLAAQLCLPRWAQGRAHRRRAMERRLVQGKARQGVARVRTGLCRMGFFSGLLSR